MDIRGGRERGMGVGVLAPEGLVGGGGGVVAGVGVRLGGVAGAGPIG